MLNFKAVEPLGMIDYLLRTFFSQHEVIRSMGPASSSLVGALSEAFESVFPDGREHEEACFRIELLDLLRQTLVHHGSHAIEHIDSQVALCIANSFHAL